MKSFFTLIFSFFITLLIAQGPPEITDFEDFLTEPETFINDASPQDGFYGASLFLPNTYNPDWMSWTGFAISNTTDVVTPNFTNYSAITGEGYDGSSTYAISFGNTKIYPDGDVPQGMMLDSFYITNSTYAYWVIKEGNNYSTKFGGESGNNPDYFYVTFKKYLAGELSQDSINFFLADYRFEDNSEDYIVDEWTLLDLSSLGYADSVSVTYTSSDAGAFGVNTPTYFCMDNVSTTTFIVGTSNKNIEVANFDIYPNPASDFLFIETPENDEVDFTIFDLLGRSILQGNTNSSNQIDIQNLVKGTYILEVLDGEKRGTELFIKQ